jgi:hypothetical protein
VTLGEETPECHEKALGEEAPSPSAGAWHSGKMPPSLSSRAWHSGKAFFIFSANDSVQRHRQMRIFFCECHSSPSVALGEDGFPRVSPFPECHGFRGTRDSLSFPSAFLPRVQHSRKISFPKCPIFGTRGRLRHSGNLGSPVVLKADDNTKYFQLLANCRHHPKVESSNTAQYNIIKVIWERLKTLTSHLMKRHRGHSSKLISRSVIKATGLDIFRLNFIRFSRKSSN